MTAKMTNDTQISFDFFTETQHKLLDLLKNELVADEVVDSWMFMNTPWPVFSTVAVYLLFVLKVGPKMMENRAPYNVKYAMLLYNLVQTLFNGYLTSLVFLTPGAVQYQFKHFCHPIPRIDNRVLTNELDKAAWYFFISKIMDLLDTVFFVLRKKQAHVSFLHVYHHTNMVITCWAYLRFIKGEQFMIGGVINSFVHTVMYSYYFIAALGPQTKKLLWWKKYVTRMQIVQFLIDIGMFMWLCVRDCNYPKVFLIYISVDIILFLFLFLRFYKRAYKIKPKSQ
ncbi:elongation of very long chain fatty acids protein 4-like [Adelges cooleyi]|uniref:elongation of very long chain fatty acids protein 4-like n=1 Tax=Adelges cooleyi TaxID=133065 RepID=UPI00217FA1E2|nr:elongation of very long chain fatty acids protein 4-like [Adelges cooleyi]XP_050425915.1 elongation of very long chain fatty acids protein 4-like [Adelges cooleyi]XP_050425916.1 elongation of very long chain fatty acids protein 4-like [Adelges cooleyi]